MRDVRELRTVARGLDHPEGIATSRDGILYAGGEAGQVYRIDPGDGAVEQIADTAGFVLGLCLDADGAIYVCDPDNKAVLRVDGRSGSVEKWCECAGGRRLTTPNWAAFDHDGSLWLSDSGTEDLHARDGRLIRVPAGGGEGEEIDLEPLHFPNGLCIGGDGAVYWLESFTPRLRRLGATGPELVADLPGVVPDGVALDSAGGFMVACYYPYQLLRVSPCGSVELVLDDSTGMHLIMPTNLAYYGEGLQDLAIAGLGGYEIKALSAHVPGAPLVYP